MSTKLENTLAAARSGDATAQNNLGLMYINAEGTAQDYTNALKWLKLSAEQGNTQAQNNLGNMYYNGLGVAQNYLEAFRWFKLSAEQGDAVGQAYLGAMHYNGLGVESNYTEALKWYKLSAEQVNTLANNNLVTLSNKSYSVERGYTGLLFDRVVSSCLGGAKHGAIRGTSTIVNHALQEHDIPSRTAQGIQHAVYYGGYFLWRYHDYVMQEASIDVNASTSINAMLKAAADTGSILFLNISLSWCSKKIKQLAEQANQNGRMGLGNNLKWFSDVSKYAVYAYDSVSIGVLETAAGIVSGIVAQFGVEQTGEYLIRHFYKTTGTTKSDSEDNAQPLVSNNHNRHATSYF